MDIIKGIIKKVWIDKTEEDIHECIIEAYNSQNFFVDHVHKTRSRSENGVDISCKKENEKIIFQIKKNPKAKDIRQLKTFSEQKADKRIYVYITAPTSDFKKEMKRVKNKVEFWDKFKLHDALIKYDSSSYLYYLFQNTNLLTNIEKTLKIFVKSRSIDFDHISGLSSEQHKFLWRIKDDSVKLKACLELCYSHWEGKLRKETSTEFDRKKEILENILTDFGQINEVAGLKMLSSFEQCKKRQPWILSYGYSAAVKGMRSDWLLFPGRSGRPNINNDKILGKEILFWLTHSNFDSQHGFYTILISVLETLTDRGDSIESLVDYTFEDFNKKR